MVVGWAPRWTGQTEGMSLLTLGGQGHRGDDHMYFFLGGGGGEGDGSGLFLLEGTRRGTFMVRQLDALPSLI